MGGGELTIALATGDPPASFVGPPGELAGEIAVTNPGDRKRWFRGCAIHVGAASIHAAPILPIGIDPGRSVRVQLHARVDASTPPGVLHGALSLGDERVPAVLHVTEHIALDVSPETLVVEAAPATRVEKTITLRNRGNVGLSFDAPRPVPLEPEAREEHVVAGILRTLETGEDAPRRAASGLLARLTTYPLELAPGHVATAAIVIELPAGLEPGTRYVGRVPLYAATLSLVIVTKSSRGASS